MTKPCCAPARDGQSPAPVAPVDRGAYSGDVVNIPGGRAFIGTNTPVFKVDGEGPLRRVTVKPFRLAVTAVTNAEFAEFINATGYTTEAETYGWSFVFHAHVPPATGPTQGIQGAEWWRNVPGARWNQITGDHGPSGYDPDHPVVHVSWNDAHAFARWVGGRLPSEIEWEHAARGGLGDVIHPWGDTPPNDIDHFPCNIWQGKFPHTNTGADGFDTTAPARSFAPNGYGLYNMAGNAWEWTADDFRTKLMSKRARAHAAAMKGNKVIKGGSFLCHESYCTRYRVAARTGNSPDSSTSHMGFRIAFDI